MRETESSDMAPPGPKTKKKSAGVVVPRATFRIKIDGEEVFEIEHPKVELSESSARERDLEEDEVHDETHDDEESHSLSEIFDAKEIEGKNNKEVSEEDSSPDLIRNRYHAYGDYVNYDDDYYHDGHFNLLEPPAPEKKRQYYYKPIGAPPAPGPPPTYYYGGGGHYSSAPVWSPPHSPSPYYYPTDVEVVDEKDCCPIVADPLAVLGLLGFIFFSTAFLNVAVSMNIGKKKKKRRRSSKDVSEEVEEVLLQGTAQG